MIGQRGFSGQKDEAEGAALRELAAELAGSGACVIADALHTNRPTAQHLLDLGLDFLLTVKDLCWPQHKAFDVFLWMLAYYVEWHLRRKLAPLVFEDAEREAAAARRQTPVEPAEVSLAAEAKAASKRTANGLPVQSLSTLLAHLASLTLNEVTLPGDDRYAFPLLAQPTPLQKEALALLGVDLPKSVSSKVTGRKSSK